MVRVHSSGAMDRCHCGLSASDNIQSRRRRLSSSSRSFRASVGAATGGRARDGARILGARTRCRKRPQICTQRRRMNGSRVHRLPAAGTVGVATRARVRVAIPGRAPMRHGERSHPARCPVGIEVHGLVFHSAVLSLRIYLASVSAEAKACALRQVRLNPYTNTLDFSGSLSHARLKPALYGRALRGAGALQVVEHPLPMHALPVV